MAKLFPRSAMALGAMLVGMTVMAFAVSTPGWTMDDSVAAPAVFRIEAHSMDSATADPMVPAVAVTALHHAASGR